MQSWKEWKRLNKENIQHIVGYEEHFVDNVLSQITLISPDDVISQYHFIDHNGKNRYIDFVIRVKQDEEKEIRLPIELDGKTKFETYQSFNDTLERQNDVMKQFGLLLRYSNKKMLNEPEEIIAEISQVIQQLKKQQDTEALLQQNFMAYQKSMNEELANIRYELDEKLAKVNQKLSDLGQGQQQQSQLVRQLADLRGRLDKLSATEQNNSQFKASFSSEQNMSVMMQQLLDIRAQLATIADSGNKAVHQPSMNLRWHKGWISFSLLILLSALALLGYGFLKNGEGDDSALGADKIPSSALSQYIGDVKTICDNLVEIYPFAQGVFLNFTQPYPKQSFSGVVWNKNIEKISGRFLKTLEQKKICIQGKIQMRNGQYQIEINDVSQISLEN